MKCQLKNPLPCIQYSFDASALSINKAVDEVSNFLILNGGTPATIQKGMGRLLIDNPDGSFWLLPGSFLVAKGSGVFEGYTAEEFYRQYAVVSGELFSKATLADSIKGVSEETAKTLAEHTSGIRGDL